MPERFSWILPKELAVGSFPRPTTSASYLNRMGITAVLCLTEVGEATVPGEITHNFLWERVSIPDGFTGGIPTVEQFEQALNILSRWRKKGHVIYVHCLAGVGRSPSVCVAYLVQNRGIDLGEALHFVKECHAYANPDVHQVRVMRTFLKPG